VGFLFRKSDIIKERKEVVIAIVPRILPYAKDYEDFEQGELIRAQTPLFQGPLCYTDRPFDAHLPDGKRVARPYIPPRANLPAVNNTPCNNCRAPWPQYYVPPKPYPRQNFVDEYANEFQAGQGGDMGGECAEGYSGPELVQPDARVVSGMAELPDWEWTPEVELPERYGRAAQVVVVDSPEGPLRLVNWHLGLAERERHWQTERLLTHHLFRQGDGLPTLIAGDTTGEANETFFVRLSNAINATITDGEGMGTILNDDA